MKPTINSNKFPSVTGDYLCRVLIPNDGGTFKQCWKVLHFSSHGFSCEGMIVVEWRDLPELPNIEL